MITLAQRVYIPTSAKQFNEKRLLQVLSGPSKLFADSVKPVPLQKSSRLQEPAFGKEPPPVMKPPSHIAEM